MLLASLAVTSPTLSVTLVDVDCVDSHHAAARSPLVITRHMGANEVKPLVSLQHGLFVRNVHASELTGSRIACRGARVACCGAARSFHSYDVP